MALFGSKNSEKKDQSSSERRVIETRKLDKIQEESHLAFGMSLEGALTGNIPVFIEGNLNGKIDCQGKITVGRKGRVEADIHCRSIVIEGEVIGNIDASESICIESSGSLKGDIKTKSFINQPGGFFEGYSHMINEEKTIKTATAKKNNVKDQ